MAVNLFKQDYDNSLIDASVNGNYFSTYHNIVTYRQKEEQGFIIGDSPYDNIKLEIIGKDYFLQYAVSSNAGYIDLTYVDGLAPGSILIVEEEKMLVTQVNYSTKRLIVTRGYDNTTITNHNSSIKATSSVENTVLSNGKSSMTQFLDPIMIYGDISEEDTEFSIIDSFDCGLGSVFSLEDESFEIISKERISDYLFSIVVNRTNPQPHLSGEVFYLTKVVDKEYHPFEYTTSPVKGSAVGERNDMILRLSYTQDGKDYSKDYPLLTYLRLVTVGTIGDSITAGHAAFRAEDHKGTYCCNGVSYDNDNTSEDVTSQYQYWLSYRLGKNYNVYNYGTGEEVGYQVKNRFVKEILSLHPDYLVIQCGTNDLSLFNGASAIAGIDSSATMDEWIFTETPITLLKNGSKTTYYGLVPAIREMVNLALDNGVQPIVGNLLPRNGLTADMRNAFDAYNNWLESYTSSIDGVYMVDYFNAQVDGEYLRDQPGDPVDYDMNDIYSSGVELNEDGSVKKSGDGIHLNSNGYKIMGYCMNIDILFDASVEGFDLYLKPDTTLQPLVGVLDTTSNIYKYPVGYKLMQLNRPKVETRYLYNKGSNNELYYIYFDEKQNVDIYFIQNDEEKEFLSGVLAPDNFLELKIKVSPQSNDNYSSIRIVGRPIEQV